MENIKMSLRALSNIAVALLLVPVGACQDLDVMNENQPDRARALSQPADVEALSGSNFVILYTQLHRSSSWINPLSPMGDEFTGTYANNATLEVANEPRIQLNNTPGTDASDISRIGWSSISSMVANSNEVLIAINKGLSIMTPDPAGAIVDNTPRARAFALFMRGVAFGYLANVWDKAPIITDADELPTEPAALNAFVIERQKPSAEVLKQAIADLEAAIAIMQQTNFTLPVNWIPGTTPNSAELTRIARSYIARFLVYNARTPQERAQVDWAKVIANTAAGITTDFGPVLDPATLPSSTYMSRIQTSGTFVLRGDYKLIGPADVSGNFQKWLATPVEQRTRFNITTPDRRITGTTPTSSGAYFRYRADDNGYRTDRGTYNFSAYQWFRRAGNTTTGLLNLFGVDELRLLRAEAFLRTGNAAEAANLANVSRTRSKTIGTATFPGLPALTTTGVPQSADCVPRDAKGACATLPDAIMYERMIEAAGSDPVRAWVDSRGWGRLPIGTILQLPIPGRELESLRVPLYTFGGVGGQGAAAKGIFDL
jgi:hypothetical protein